MATNVAARGLDIDDVQLIIQVCSDQGAIVIICPDYLAYTAPCHIIFNEDICCDLV